MRPSRTWWVLLLSAIAITARANDDWPTHYTFGNGVDVGLKGLLQYDSNDFGKDRLPDGMRVFDDAHAWRRKEFYLYVSKSGVFEINAGYDFQARAWVDNYLAVETPAGRFRAGQFKTPVGWEDGNTSTSATLFLERALPEQAVHEGRRVGVEWQRGIASKWLLQAAWFARGDLNADADGTTIAGRAVFTPVRRTDAVVHLGVSVSREERDSGAARVRARPEVALTPVRLVDTGALQGVDHIDRVGVEAGWLRGPLLVQAEYLTLRAQRPATSDFTSQGGYITAAWLLTGEAHGYKASGFTNPVPARPWGAVELALRFSALDLDDGNVTGGREHDWTLGLNWYLGKHFKLQANYIRAFSDRGDLHIDPRIFALRAQVAF
ncbi:MAG TPA: porin [Rhodanobacteraceae bacterium]|nr:porin [Rhodanobacteraceae bacterium]